MGRHRRPQTRDVGSDLRWGAKEGFWLTIILLVPAGFAVLGQSRRQFFLFLAVVCGYLIFGMTAGLLVGAARPRLKQRRVSLSLGAGIGAAGFVLLTCFADSRVSLPNPTLALIAAAAGAATGAGVGWYAWWRAPSWHQEAHTHRE